MGFMDSLNRPSSVGSGGPLDPARLPYLPGGRWPRRQFLQALAGAGAGIALGQTPGERPVRSPELRVLNPRNRVPLSFIIDDSTCLVNLNRFAMPQFDAAFQGSNPTYRRDWPDWPVEIPDRFVRRFAEWCADQGVRGKFSIVPYPACVGRLDREVPGWSAQAVADSLAMVREVITPHWDIHPEMVTHTRVIDLKTGHPVPERSLKFMENWDWTTGRSADEIAAYMVYALRILKEVGLPVSGITTPGGFGNRALPQLAQATFQAVREVFAAEIPHYFRHAFDRGTESVAPRVENAFGLDGPDPRCVVSIVACTGDWTGGWDNRPPVGADAYITEDLQRGRMVDIIERGEPACPISHWTGIHHNGAELGFAVFREVVRRLHTRFDNLVWMKLSEISRYWAAKELTRWVATPSSARFHAPFSCPEFTVRCPGHPSQAPGLTVAGAPTPLREIQRSRDLVQGTWCRENEGWIACFNLPRGESTLGW